MTRESYPGYAQTFALLLGTLLLGGALSAIAWFALEDWPRIAQMALPTEIALAAAVVYGVRRADRPWPEALAFRPFPARLLPSLALVLVGSVTVFSELYLVIQRVAPVPEEFEAMLRELMSMDGPVDVVLTLLVAVVAAPILEEALFRGVVLHGLARRYGPGSASVWSAAFFALFHFYNPWQILPTFFLGLVLAWLVLATRSLVAAILVHAAFNAVSLAVFQVSLDGADPAAGTVPWMVVGIVALLLVGSAALLWGLATIERETGGGWFATGEEPHADPPAARPAYEPVEPRPGPRAARG